MAIQFTNYQLFIDPVSQVAFRAYGDFGTLTLGTVTIKAEDPLPILTNSNASPITATMLFGPYGQKYGYRAFKIHALYSGVTVPGPYLDDPDQTIYYRNGGNLVQVSGDGIDTPRVYEWRGPYDPLEVEFSNAGEYQMPAYTGTMPTVNETVTVTGRKYVVEWGFVWNDIDPGLDS
jgi:hypothetical protein